MSLTFAQIEAARPAVAALARVTPLIASRRLSELTEAEVWLKAEVLQRTGSFKVRGAANFIHQMSAEERARGVIAASAGNHAQGVAVAAAAQGVPCRVVMPHGTALPKERATREYGALVVLHGADLGEAESHARGLAEQSGEVYVPPFDHAQIIAGQGTLGLELLDQAPALDTVIIPVGGGGLAAGTALALKTRRPSLRVIGVQAARVASAAASHHRTTPLAVPRRWTLADGTAVPRVGDLTLPLLNQYVDEILPISEEWISAAMVWLLERAKLVVEGAGALGVAALLAGAVDLRHGATAVVLSGGNIDVNSLAKAVEHGLARSGRYTTFTLTVHDRPGELARILHICSEQQVNLLDVSHRRRAPTLPVGGVEIELLLETRDAAHAAQVTGALLAAGFRQVEAQLGLIRLCDPTLEPAP